MIQFRCSACGKRYNLPVQRIGERLDCSCGQHLKVPPRSGGSAKYRTWPDFFIELAVYGVGGAVLGFLLGVVLLKGMGHVGLEGWLVVLPTTAVGFLAGGLVGERGINWIGRKIREHERD